MQIYCRRPSPAETAMLAGLGADVVGWDVRPGDAAALELSASVAAAARTAGIQTCLLVLSESLAAIAAVARSVVPDYLVVAAELRYDGPAWRLAGQLDASTALVMSVPVRPAGSRTELDSLAMARQFQEFAQALILDTCPDPDTVRSCGQTGVTNDWEVCARIVEGSAVPVMLAGGLGPDNVASAIAAVRPWGVDACTALERPDGTKDPRRCAEFIRAARAAFATVGLR